MGIHSKSTPALPFCYQNAHSRSGTLSLRLKHSFRLGSESGELICHPLFTGAEVTEGSSKAAWIEAAPSGWNIPAPLSAGLLSFVPSPDKSPASQSCVLLPSTVWGRQVNFCLLSKHAREWGRGRGAVPRSKGERRLMSTKTTASLQNDTASTQ